MRAIQGLYSENGKESGSYDLGFKAYAGDS